MPRRSSGAQCPWVGWGTWLRAFPEEPWTSFWSKACRGEWGWSKEASFTKGLVFRWIYFHHHRENWKKFMYSRSVYFCKFSILKFFKHINSLRNKSGKPSSLFFCLLTCPSPNIYTHLKSLTHLKYRNTETKSYICMVCVCMCVIYIYITHTRRWIHTHIYLLHMAISWIFSLMFLRMKGSVRIARIKIFFF